MTDIEQLEAAVKQVASDLTMTKARAVEDRESLRQAREKLKFWETRMPCGHPEAALIVDDPPHCAVCDREFMRTSVTIERDALKRTLSRSGHDMDTSGRCSADCQACEKTRQEGRDEAADALDHLRTCPPNMCRDGHPEIRYEQTEDSTVCPLCFALMQLGQIRQLLLRFFNKRSAEVLGKADY